METFIHRMESYQLPCFFNSSFGIECPGCGTQRAFISLLKGEFVQSFQTYPPLIFFLSLLIFLFLHLLFKFKNGGTYLKYFFISTAFVVLINCICKSSKNEFVRNGFKKWLMVNVTICISINH